jgi:U-box domain
VIEEKESKTLSTDVFYQKLFNKEEETLEIPNGFECPITGEIMNKPRMAADGFTYEESAIQQWFDEGKTISPMTGKELEHKQLTKNLSLHQAIQDFKQTEKQLLEKHKQLQDAQSELQEKKRRMSDAELSETELLAKLNITSDSSQKKQDFIQAANNFVKAMQIELTRHPDKIWYNHAANTFVSSVLRCIRKGIYNAMLLDPENEHGIPKELIGFIKQHVQQNPALLYARYFQALSDQLEKQLYIIKGEEILSLPLAKEEKKLSSNQNSESLSLGFCHIL